jgi:hypothetical protein
MDRLLESLPVMGFGMLGIFIVMVIIYIITAIIGRIGNKKA